MKTSIFKAAIFLIVTLPSYVIADVEIILLINNKPPGAVTTDIRAIKSMFCLRTKTWTNHLPVVVYVLPPETPASESFSRKLFNVHSYQLERAWDRELFSGGASRPIVVLPEHMLQAVRSTPGAIGYVERASFNESDSALKFLVIP